MYFLATPGIGNLVQAHDDLKDYTQEAGLASKRSAHLSTSTLRRQSWRSAVCDMTCNWQF